MVGRPDGRTVGLLGVVAFLSASPTVRQSDAFAILDRTSAVYDTVRTLSADFVQVIENPMAGVTDTSRGRLYQQQPDRFAMRFSVPQGDRIVADGRWLWLYTPSSTPGQVIRSPVPAAGTTGPNLLTQFAQRPRERYVARHLRAETVAGALTDVIALVPRDTTLPYRDAVVWVRRDNGLLARIELLETSGQRRVVALRNVRVNAGVPAREFTFSPPAGSRVVDQ
jgi:outer membrane lipoprotein carrier protein